MFDRSLTQSLINDLSPEQRGATAALALTRLRAMVLADQRAEVASLSTRQVMEDAYNYCMARATDHPSGDSGVLRGRFEELLGSDEFPIEGPEDIEPWFVEVVSTADYAVRVWEQPEASGDTCFNVLLSAYAVVGNLEDDPGLPSGPPLGQWEFDRQVADMRALSQQVSVSELADLGAGSAQTYAARFMAYIAHYQG